MSKEGYKEVILAVHGIWFLVQLMDVLLAVDGFIPSNINQMAQLIGTKFVWLHVASRRPLVLTMLNLSPLWLD